MDKKFKPPKHLSAEMRKWFASVVETYELEDSHVKILTLACQAWDRAESARKTLDEKGTTYMNRFSDPVARPEVAIERDSRLAFARLLRELNLSEEPAESRPPGLKYGGK